MTSNNLKYSQLSRRDNMNDYNLGCLHCSFWGTILLRWARIHDVANSSQDRQVWATCRREDDLDGHY
jgi:hypothetical protein